MSADQNGSGAIKVLRPSIVRSVGMAIACAVMAIVCFQLWFKGTESAWIAGGFMAAGTVFFLVHLVPDAYALWVYPQGFEVSDMYSRKRYRWSEVSEFSIRRGLLGHYVDFYHAAPELEVPKRVILNETYGFKPVEILQLLNQHRKQAADAAQAPRPNVWRNTNGP
jgi:hypothetical protein